MKVGQRTDPLCLVLKHDTALNLGDLKVVEGPERAVGHTLVGERPQAEASLQFGGIGWQEEQMDALGHHELFARMPPRSIQHQQDPLGGASSDSDAAKWASAIVNTSAVTVGSSSHSVLPVAGWRKL